MIEISLLDSTNNPQADEILRGVIGICEMVFSERVRAYYLVGSYQGGTAVARSDDEAARRQAHARLSEVIYNDPEVQAALTAEG